MMLMSHLGYLCTLDLLGYKKKGMKLGGIHVGGVKGGKWRVGMIIFH